MDFFICVNIKERGNMPEISRFLGIKITMYQDDHNPPHFHAVYSEYEAQFSIAPLEIIKGKLPPRVLGMIMEWASMHKNELLKNWESLQNGQQIKKIKPLV